MRGDKRIYLDGGSGVAGDMLLSAQLDLGLPLRELVSALKQVAGPNGWNLQVRRTERLSWPATSLEVVGDGPFGTAVQMKRAIRRSRLPSIVKIRAERVIASLEWAEGRAHRRKAAAFDPEGLGVLDTLIDVVGNVWGFWRLGIQEMLASPLNTGRIAPATAQLLSRAKVPVYSRQSELELATPTGVALLIELATRFESMPAATLGAAGYGAGQKDLPGRPNVLGLYQIGRGAAATWSQEPVVLLETAIDDMDPRLYPHVTELLFKEGALDAWWVAAGMKKGRPGVLYSVLCRPESEQRLLGILFNETTTLGIRRLPLDRWTLPRRQQGLTKTALLPGGEQKNQVEYELARQAALRRAIPLRKLLK